MFDLFEQKQAKIEGCKQTDHKEALWYQVIDFTRTEHYTRLLYRLKVRRRYWLSRPTSVRNKMGNRLEIGHRVLSIISKANVPKLHI